MKPTHALAGATTAAALSLPHSVKRWDFNLEDLITLPLEQFGWFDTLTLDEAKSGIIKQHNHSAVAEAVEDAVENFFGVDGDDSSSATTTAVASKTHAVIISTATSMPSSSDSDSDSDVSPEVSNVKTAAATDDGATCSPNPESRIEWRDYSDSDRHAFVDAIKCLMEAPSAGDTYSPSTSRYEDIVRVHQAMTSTIHGNNIFLLWHRYYLWSFEKILRNECGFDRTFPWWDETLDAGNFAASSLFTNDFFGSLPTATDGQATCITDGAFAGLTCHIGPGDGFQDHCLARSVDESLTSQCNSDFVTTCNSRGSYSEMENCAELGPHAYGHNGVGSVMADVSASPSDPIFFMHHTFIDRNYFAWQDTAARRAEVDGCIDSNSPCTALTLDTPISVMGLLPDVTVRDVVNTLYGAMCYQYSY